MVHGGTSRPEERSGRAEPRKRPAEHLDPFRWPWLPPAALAVLTVLVYWPSLSVPVHYSDDYIYYFRDARLEPVTLQSLWRIVADTFYASYHPVTSLTYAFDRAVWGTWVPGFHLTQLFFYVGGVLGVYFLFARILAWPAGALGAAAIYGVHTIHVEAVAWLASRKDVVCLFFYAFSLLAYVRYAGSPQERRGSYALSLALAAAAMMSKAYAVALPAVLFAYDLCFSKRLTRRQILDKLPYLVLSAAAVFLTVYAQDRERALIESTMPWDRRVGILAKVMALYIGRSFVPIHLSAFYTVGSERTLGPLVMVGAYLALALVAGFVLLRRRLPAAAFGIALFLLPLGTVTNVFFTLRIWITDRYLLFPTIGSCLALAALAAHMLKRRRGAAGESRVRVIRRGLATATVLLVGAYSAMTVARIGVWSSHLSLWSDVIRKQYHLGGSGPVTAEELNRVTNLASMSTGPILSLARAHTAAGNNAEAERISALLGRVGGGSGEQSELDLASRALEAGRLEEARRRLTPIAESRSWVAPIAMLYLSAVQDRMGDAEAARRMLQRGIEAHHKNGQLATDGLLEVGEVDFRRRDFARAAAWCRLAYQESPREAKTLFYLGRALDEAGRSAEAMALYARLANGSVPIPPDSPFTILDVTIQMGIAEERLGHAGEAIRHFEEVLRRSPAHPKRQLILDEIAKLRSRGAP